METTDRQQKLWHYEWHFKNICLSPAQLPGKHHTTADYLAASLGTLLNDFCNPPIITLIFLTFISDMTAACPSCIYVYCCFPQCMDDKANLYMLAIHFYWSFICSKFTSVVHIATPLLPFLNHSFTASLILNRHSTPQRITSGMLFTYVKIFA